MMVYVRFKPFTRRSGVRPIMRVLIADDQPSVRFALKLVLEQQGIDVAGDVADSGELLAWFKTNQADLLLLDWELPDQPGKKIIPILRARYPGLTVIVLNSRPQTRTEAISAGADGFVSKGDPPEYLLSLLATALRADRQK
jgi:two-component system alkaline phosphatase synthesis response regulator PhoP